MVTFREDLLSYGVLNKFYVSNTEPNTVYRVTGFQRSRSTNDHLSVRRVPYNIIGQEKTELGATKPLDLCLEDERVENFRPRRNQSRKK